MKVINKILCFLSVFVLCVPLLCFTVFSEDISDNLYPSAESVQSIDTSQFPIYYTDFTKRSKQFISGHDTVSSSDSLSFPYKKLTVNNVSYKFDLSNYYDIVNYFLSAYCSNSLLIDASNLYYYCYISKVSDTQYLAIFYYSSSFIYFSYNGSFFHGISDSPIICSTFNISSAPDGTNTSCSTSYVSTTPYTTSSLGWKFSPDCSSYLNATSFNSVWTSNHYTFSPDVFIVPFKSGNFPNFLENASHDGINYVGFDSDNGVSEYAPTLADSIDVKITPEFTTGMDRSIPDSTFGISEDYWSLEVTNYNDFNIQFKCYVIPATGAVNYVSEWSHDESLKSYSSGISVLVNTDDFIPVVPDETVWMLEKDQWIYSKETENQEDYFKDTPYLVNKPTSNFFLQAGGTFKQVIKWNQLNLNKNQPYQLLVTACQCPYDRASDIHISLASDDYSQSFKHIIEESYFIIYDNKFSVSNPLYYDSTDKFGGVIANTGSSQVNTDYWKMNAIKKDGEIEIRNADYSNGWRLNPDGGSDSGTLKEGLFNNLDDISISDVTKLVQDSSNYFSVIATVFKVFPVWIWVLLFAGISGLVVIGIFKMLH